MRSMPLPGPQWISWREQQRGVWVRARASLIPRLLAVCVCAVYIEVCTLAGDAVY